MKKAVLIGIILAGALSAQSVSDKVLFDRATALVKGLRTGTSWNKSISDLKKDFPDLKELEPFKVSEDAVVQTQEFGALYNFDSEALNKYFELKCTNYPLLIFSFYQKKLYRVETSYCGIKDSLYLGYKIAYSFFNKAEKDSVIERRKKTYVRFRYDDVRLGIDSYTGDDFNKLGCDRNAGYYIQRHVYTNMPIENMFYAEQSLLHPELGYVNVKWDDTFQDVANVYKDMIEKSDGDSVWGRRDFRQVNKNGDVNYRTFSFYQGKLFQVNVNYKVPGSDEMAKEKLNSIYRWDVPVARLGGITYYSPSSRFIKAHIAQQKESHHKGQEKKQQNETEL